MHVERPVMAAALSQDLSEQYGERSSTNYLNSIPPAIKAILEDLSEIRKLTLVESPQLLPLIAPSLIEAEIHVRQLWMNQG